MDNKEVGDKSKALSHGNINYGATLSQDLSSDQLSLDQFEIRREKKEDHIIATDYDTGLHPLSSETMQCFHLILNSLFKALLECGYGRWHWMLAMSCGLANAADAVEILCTSFLLPSAECDLQLTNLRKGTIPIVGFVGMLIGGFLWGTLGKYTYNCPQSKFIFSIKLFEGDIYGRRSTLIIAMFVNAVFGAVSAASWDYATFLLLRFLSGLGYETQHFSLIFRRYIRHLFFQRWWQHSASVDIFCRVPAQQEAGRGAEPAGHILDGGERDGGGPGLGHHPAPAELGLLALVHAGLRRPQPPGLPGVPPPPGVAQVSALSGQT